MVINTDPLIPTRFYSDVNRRGREKTKVTSIKYIFIKVTFYLNIDITIFNLV